MAEVRIEVRHATGGRIFSEALEPDKWIDQRRLSGGVVWLAHRNGVEGVVLVQRSHAAPSNANHWSYFSGAADSVEDVLVPPRLAREGSEELMLMDDQGKMSVPILACALGAREEIIGHCQARTVAEGATRLVLCPTVDALHPHRLCVQTGFWIFAGSAFASVKLHSGRPRLELAWFGALGSMDDMTLLDGEVSSDGVPLRRRLRFVPRSDISDFLSSELVTSHAQSALEHLVAKGDVA